MCHATAPEFHKEGPSLAGVYGRRAGTAPFFAGYEGLRGADFVWDERTLDAWLTDPRGLLDGKNTAMTLRLNDAGQRADVIAATPMNKPVKCSLRSYCVSKTVEAV